MKTGTASLMPSKEEVISVVKDYGMVTAGMIAAHALVKSTKDTTMVNGGIAVAGLGVAVAAKNPYLKMAGIGAAVYGTIKVISKAVVTATAPASTDGLAGLIPEKAKELLRKYIPTLSGIDEIAGVDDENMSGTDDEINGLQLDDLSLRLPSYSENSQSMEGLGVAVDLVA